MATGIPTDKSSALSALVARSQTPKSSADVPVGNNKPPLKSSTDTLSPDEIAYINSQDSILQDAIARAARAGICDCEMAGKASVEYDIREMVDAVQKETGVTMSHEDIHQLVQYYANTVTEIGQGANGEIQKGIVDHFVKQLNPPSDIDLAKEIAKEIGLDPKLLVDFVEQSPTRPVTEDQLKTKAEQFKYDW